jgi:hypothetical protein
MYSWGIPEVFRRCSAGREGSWENEESGGSEGMTHARDGCQGIPEGL